jgi:hypothetical protein
VPGDSAIELSGSLSFSDTIRFHYFNTLHRIWWLVVLVAILLLVVVPMLLAFFVNTYPPIVSWSWVVENAGPYWAVLAALLCVVAVPYVGAKKQFAAQSHPPQPLKVSFTSEGISSEGVGFSSKIAWSFVKSVRETKSLFLLYYSTGTAMVVPKRFFRSSEELER